MGRLPPLQGHASRERSRNAGRASLVSETDLPAARGLSATGTLCRGWDVGRLCYFRWRSRAKREEVRGRGEQSAVGWDAGAGLPGPVSAQVEGQLPGGHRLSSARATAGHLSRAVLCWEITSPGELKAWPGLLVSFPCGEVYVQFFLQTSFKAARDTGGWS